jgi:hypothetical protein
LIILLFNIFSGSISLGINMNTFLWHGMLITLFLTPTIHGAGGYQGTGGSSPAAVMAVETKYEAAVDPQAAFIAIEPAPAVAPNEGEGLALFNVEPMPDVAQQDEDALEELGAEPDDDEDDEDEKVRGEEWKPKEKKVGCAAG